MLIPLRRKSAFRSILILKLWGKKNCQNILINLVLFWGLPHIWAMIFQPINVRIELLAAALLKQQ